MSLLDHEAIIEEAERSNRLEYDNNDKEESDKDYLESKVDSNGGGS